MLHDLAVVIEEICATRESLLETVGEEYALVFSVCQSAALASTGQLIDDIVPREDEYHTAMTIFPLPCATVHASMIP
jgi:hypothetical protein